VKKKRSSVEQITVARDCQLEYRRAEDEATVEARVIPFAVRMLDVLRHGPQKCRSTIEIRPSRHLHGWTGQSVLRTRSHGAHARM
jgi:hypothetical protein